MVSQFNFQENNLNAMVQIFLYHKFCFEEFCFQNHLKRGKSSSCTKIYGWKLKWWTSEWKIKIHFHSHRNKSQLLKNLNYSKNCDEGNRSIISFEMISMARILILFVVLMVLCSKTIVIDASKSQVIRLNWWIVFHARFFFFWYLLWFAFVGFQIEEPKSHLFNDFVWL